MSVDEARRTKEELSSVGRGTGEAGTGGKPGLVQVELVGLGRGPQKLVATCREYSLSLETECWSDLVKALGTIADVEADGAVIIPGIAAATLLEINGPISVAHGKKILSLAEHLRVSEVEC